MTTISSNQRISIFQPPPLPETDLIETPSARTLRPPRPSHNRNVANGEDESSRKRARHSYSSEDDRVNATLVTPSLTPYQDWSQVSPLTSSTTYFSSALPSPAPFVNTRYEIKGGLDTPSIEIEQRYESWEQSKAGDYIGAQHSRLQPRADLCQMAHESVPETPEWGLTNTIHSKRKLAPDKPGWTRTLVGTMGGIAWKGINFAFTTAFRGFYAGGGTGYDMSVTEPVMVEGNHWQEMNNREDVFNEDHEPTLARERTPIPGQFPEDDPEVSPVPHHRYQLSKSRHLMEGKENHNLIKDDWTVVQNEEVDEVHSSPHGRNRSLHSAPLHRTASNASIAGTRLRPTQQRRSSLVSQAGSPSIRRHRPASFASPRSLHRSSHPELSRTSRSPSPSKSHPSLSADLPRASVGARSNRLNGTLTPTSPDVQQFERKVRLKEKKEDENIRRLNKQLRDMIREGKEALKTKIDVESGESEEEDEDEGYAEGKTW